MGKVNFYLILFFIIFSLFFYAENSDADSCPAAIASLLGSGCHDMGSAYFNGEMTQYVNYGGTVVYSCSTNYLSGCSGGSNTTTSTTTIYTSCPSNIASLLGSGCHTMDSAYFNGEMTQYVNYGGTVVYSCSTNYLSGCSSGSSTGGGGGVPATPSNLRSDPAPAATAIYLAWNDNSYNEDKFNLEREVANSANWATLTQTGPNIISYTDLTAISATTYNYRVQACLSGYGCSEYVYLTGVSLSAPSDIQPPSTPTGFSAYAVSSSQINLFWTASSDNAGVSGYKIYRNESLRDQVTVLSFSDTGLNSNTSYGYYVRAFDATGNESSPSSIVSAITYSVSATTTGTTTSTSCPSSIANLLGSGCHDMGSAYFNGEMTQYVNYGGTAVYSCASNYLSGCSGSSNTVATSTADIIPPYVVKFGYTVESDGRLRAGASFSESLSDSTLTDSNIYIINSSNGIKISGAVNKYQGSIDYLTSSPAETGINYQLIVRKNVKDLAGNQMTSDYYSAFFQRSPTPVSSVFAVDTSATLPKNNETGVDVGLKIKVKLTKAIDPASTLKQFFALEANNAPGVAVGGSFYMSGDGFEFAQSFALMPGTTYTYKVLASLKDSGGNYLSAPFSALFTTASGVMSGSAAVSGTVRDGAKNPVVGATVHIFAEDYSRSFSIATDSAGAFRMSIAGGSYVAEILPSSGRNDLLKPQPVKFSISLGEAKTLDLSFISGAKIISGTVLFPDTKPVTDAEVGVYSSGTNQWKSANTDSTGKYTLTVGGGTWKIGIRPRSTSTATWSWNESLPEVTFSQDASGETKTVNFIVTFANATLVVYTVDNYGNPLPNAGVVVDTLSSTQVLSSNEVRVPPKFRQSDSSGKVTILLAPRIYYIRGSLPSELGYFNPPEQEINLPSAETRQMRLVFRKPEVVSFVTVSGSAILDNGEVADNVFVSAWSEKGGFMETRADLKGAFSMRMTSCERWRIAAGKNYGGFPYKSSELIMDVGYKPLNAELVLVKVANRPLPASVNVVQSAATQIMAQVEDGAKIVIPPKSAAGSGSVSVEIAPTVEAPSQAAAKVVSTVYDVTIRNAG